MMYYAGIGSRETPNHTCDKMKEIARLLEEKGFILRSGGAKGADKAFDDGCSEKEIFRPDYYFISGVKHEYVKKDLDFADLMVREYHPSKGRISNIHAYKLQARNTFQIFGCGDNTVNSQFVICYTSDGAETYTTHTTSGTGQAIRIANGYDIPVFNLRNHIEKTPQEIIELIFKTIDNE